MNNIINIQISAADDTAITTAIATIVAKLTPYLHALTDEERRGGFKMGDKSVAFVNKGSAYGTQFATEMPASVKVADLNTDVIAVNKLNSYFKPLSTLMRGVEDTMMLAGGEAMEQSVMVYAAIKMAAHNNSVGAQEAYNDMKERFPGAPSKKSSSKNTPPSNP